MSKYPNIEGLFIKQKEYLGCDKDLNKIQPLVSVYVTAYQHTKYISECLEGIRKQLINFPLEIVLGEDESTDGTRDICKKYAEKYQDKIRLFLRDRNQTVIYGEDGKFLKSFNGILTIMSCRGKYIAMCEGDDYWTDPYKLQKQVDFLEMNPEFSICFHGVRVLRNGKLLEDDITREVGEETDILELAKGNYIHTPSVVYRNKLFNNFPESFFKAPVGDYYLHMLNAKYGKIKKINQVMAVYRIHDKGMHSQKLQSRKNDEWVTQLSLMIPSFEGEAKNILIDSFLDFARIVLLKNNLPIQRQSQILKNINELRPTYFIQLIEENEKLKIQLKSPRYALATILNSLKKKLSR